MREVVVHDASNISLKMISQVVIDKTAFVFSLINETFLTLSNQI